MWRKEMQGVPYLPKKENESVSYTLLCGSRQPALLSARKISYDAKQAVEGMISGTRRRRVNTLFTVIYSRQSLSGKQGDVKEDF